MKEISTDGEVSPPLSCDSFVGELSRMRYMCSSCVSLVEVNRGFLSLKPLEAPSGGRIRGRSGLCRHESSYCTKDGAGEMALWDRAALKATGWGRG